MTGILVAITLITWLSFVDKMRSAVKTVPRNAQERQHLMELLTDLPRARWAAIVSAKGMAETIYPDEAALEDDRIAAMSAAMASLGQRISGELHTGKFNYCLISGQEGVTLVAIMADTRLLAVGLEPGASLDAALSACQLFVQQGQPFQS